MTSMTQTTPTASSFERHSWRISGSSWHGCDALGGACSTPLIADHHQCRLPASSATPTPSRRPSQHPQPWRSYPMALRSPCASPHPWRPHLWLSTLWTQCSRSPPPLLPTCHRSQATSSVWTPPSPGHLLFPSQTCQCTRMWCASALTVPNSRPTQCAMYTNMMTKAARVKAKRLDILSASKDLVAGLQDTAMPMETSTLHRQKLPQQPSHVSRRSVVQTTKTLRPLLPPVTTDLHDRTPSDWLVLPSPPGKPPLGRACLVLGVPTLAVPPGLPP